MNELIRLDNIGKSYGDHEVLSDISLSIRENEFVTLLGPSGCGKTTTLRIIGGFETPDIGKVIFDGKDITNVPPNQRNVNTVFQNYALFPHMTVQENIAFGLRVSGKSEQYIKDKIAYGLKLVNLDGYGNRRVDKMSGGQQQRVALARSLVLEPKVLLLDEPLSNIDTKLRETVRNEIRKIQKELGITMIFVTHDQEEAMSISDRIVVMNGGNIEQIGTPREIYTFPETVFVAEFIGKANIIKRDKKSFIIRPENVNISYNEINEGNTDEVISEKGKIISKEYHGALISYEIEVMNELSGLKRLNAVMISGKKEFETGEIVRYSINKQDLYEIKS